jgi:anti-sigma regulatory factor (Ser/Thr protein kinase)
MEPLTVQGTLESLEPIRRHVQQAASAAGLNGRATYDLALAVDELVTNAVTHGYQENGLDGQITVTTQTTDRELVVMIEDSAPMYDPRTHRVPTKEDLLKPLTDRNIGGLGVYLVLQGVDRYDYQRAGDRNRSILGMKRTEAP